MLIHAAVKWLHSFAPESFPNPLDNTCCKNIVKSAKRTRNQPINKKKPADAEVIKNIIDKYGTDGAFLKDLRIAVISALDFAGFFRFTELANIQPSHLTFHDDCVKIFVATSKSDVY